MAQFPATQNQEGGTLTPAPCSPILSPQEAQHIRDDRPESPASHCRPQAFHHLKDSPALSSRRQEAWLLLDVEPGPD